MDPIENSNPPGIAPNIDAELDAALGKAFTPSNEAPPQENIEKPNDNRVEQPKKSEPVIEKNKVELKPEEKRAEKPIETEKPLPTQEEIEKINEKDKGAWGAIKNANKRAHSMIEQKESEIAKLKAALAEKGSASQKELDAIKAEKADLEKYRAMVDIQADPEFISKYDQPIEKAVTGIKDMIKALGVSQEVVDGIDFTNPARLENVIDLISQNKDRFTASKIERKIKDYLDLADKRNETLEDQKKNYKETLEKRKKELFAKESEGEGRMLKQIELKVSEKGKEGKPLLPFLNRQEPKENSTQAEIDQVKTHNLMVDNLTEKLQSVLKMKEPEQQAEVAIAAVASHYLMAQLRATVEELRKAKEELGKMAAVTTETPARKSNNPTGKNGSSEPLDTDAALSQHFAGRR